MDLQLPSTTSQPNAQSKLLAIFGEFTDAFPEHLMARFLKEIYNTELTGIIRLLKRIIFQYTKETDPSIKNMLFRCAGGIVEYLYTSSNDIFGVEKDDVEGN